MDEIRILFDIAVILIAAKIGGELTERLKLSRLVGEIGAGILVGPLLHIILPTSYDFISFFALIGIVLLMFLIGMEIKIEEFKEELYPGTYIAVAGDLICLVAGFVIGYMLFNSIEAGLIAGIVLMGTSDAIPIKMLEESGNIKSKLGRLLITTTTVDDVISLIVLAAIMSFLTFGAVHIWNIVALVFTIIGFIYIFMKIGGQISNGIFHYIQKLNDRYIILGVTIGIIFILAFVSQRIGIAAVTGAFLLGMVVGKSDFSKETLEPNLKMIGYSIFIPIFFAFSAVNVELAPIFEYWWLITIFVVVGILLKSVISGWMSGLFGLHSKDQMIFAVGTIPRGEYGIIAAQLALGMAVISIGVYSALMMVIVITSLITPVLLSILLKSRW
ncbi:MAG: cation:proton antiporter [Candidatus Aenigmatarchaeota archaeon]